MAQVDTRLLLKVIRSLDLRRGVPDTVATHLEDKLDYAISREGGIPLDDPLRFGSNGEQLPTDMFHKKLDWIIQLWPIDKGEWRHGRKTNHKGRL